jgi:hypothetical protein
MALLMTKALRGWVEADYHCLREEMPELSKGRLLAEIVRRYEQAGDAMRFLNSRGKIAWKASPRGLRRLADAEREVMDDSDDYS